jgi:hypothetical protein
VDPSLIVLEDSGAVLLPPARECPHAAVRDDVAGFGAILQSLLAAAALGERVPAVGASPGSGARTGRSSIFAAGGRLAGGCREHPGGHTMHNAAVSLGLLSVLARQGGMKPPASHGASSSVPAKVADPPAPGRVLQPCQMPLGVDPMSFLGVEDPERHLVPSVESCPKCGAHYVALSRQRGWVEAAMGRAGLPIRRCCICFHRYFKLLGIALAKAPQA